MSWKKHYDLSTPAGRAMKLLDDPKWSWNRFPWRQINFITYYTHRYTSIDLYHIVRTLRLVLTGTYSNTVPRNEKMIG